MRLRFGGLPQILLLPLLLLGCERMQDVKRCRALAREVNLALDGVEKEASGKQPVAWERIAKQYSALATSLEGFDGGTPELEKAVNELSILARNTARQSTALGAALDGGNKGTAQLSTNELERLARHQKLLAARIDDECRPK